MFWEKRDSQWLSLDRPRSYPALHSFDHPTSTRPLPSPTLALLSSLPIHLLYPRGLRSKLHIAKMGAIPEYDPEEPQETKPFKFVTGKF